MQLTILLPCLNEEKTLAETIKEIKAELAKIKYTSKSEILVVDNNSCDNSFKIAQDLNTRVVKEFKEGYGNALRRGLKEARGKYIIFGDCDRSYSFSYIKEYLNKLERGADIVIGNRFLGHMQKGAMPFLHKYIGTPVISFLGNKLYKINVGDFNCGLRAIKKEILADLNFKTSGMEFATEMLVKARKNNLVIAEVPINFYKDKRECKPHLKTFRDGLRHLKVLVGEINNEK